MKTIAFVAILALSVTSMATPWLTAAHISGPSATGSYRFVSEDTLTKTLDFEVSSNEQGSATGRMTFQGDAVIVEGEADEVPERSAEPSQFFIKADLDSLTVENNRALMGGIVQDSSHRSYIGKWVQLVVEDNGDGGEVSDQLSWRFCQPEPGGWVPSDAEDPRDEGAWWKWWATDAEREDDRGVASTNLIPGTRRGCQTFPLSSYEFPEVKGEGQIRVQP